MNFQSNNSWLDAQNNKEKRTQKIPGSQNGLRMVINTQLYNYTEQAEDGFTESGLRVQVHPTHEPPQVQRLGVGIPTGVKAFLAVDKTNKHNMQQPWGDCDANNEARRLNRKYFHQYSSASCMEECQADVIMRMCQCTGWFLTNKRPKRRKGNFENFDFFPKMSHNDQVSANNSGSTGVQACFRAVLTIFVTFLKNHSVHRSISMDTIPSFLSVML